MVTTVSYAGLAGVQNQAERYVRSGAGFKPATQGTLLGRAVTWIKETLFPGRVRQENVEAYRSAQLAFFQSGTTEEEAHAVFDGRLSGDHAFTPADLGALQQAAATDRAAALAHNQGVGQSFAQPFGQARMDDLVTRMGVLFDTSKRDVAAEPASTGSRFQVSHGFKTDGAVRTVDLRYAGAATTDFSLQGEERLERLCAGLSAKGLSPHDILTLTRIANQATPGCMLEQMMATSAFPVIRSFDGQDLMVTPMLNNTVFDVVPTTRGLNVEFTASGTLTGAPTLQGNSFEFGAGSKTEARFTLVLERGQDNRLALTGMHGAGLSMTAFDKAGRQLV